MKHRVRAYTAMSKQANLAITVPVGQAAPLAWKITRSFAEFSGKMWIPLN